jgi:hypothetical protein
MLNFLSLIVIAGAIMERPAPPSSSARLLSMAAGYSLKVDKQIIFTSDYETKQAA